MLVRRSVCAPLSSWHCCVASTGHLSCMEEPPWVANQQQTREECITRVPTTFFAVPSKATWASLGIFPTSFVAESALVSVLPVHSYSNRGLSLSRVRVLVFFPRARRGRETLCALQCRMH